MGDESVGRQGRRCPSGKGGVAGGRRYRDQRCEKNQIQTVGAQARQGEEKQSDPMPKSRVFLTDRLDEVAVVTEKRRRSSVQSRVAGSEGRCGGLRQTSSSYVSILSLPDPSSGSNLSSGRSLPTGICSVCYTDGPLFIPFILIHPIHPAHFSAHLHY